MEPSKSIDRKLRTLLVLLIVNLVFNLAFIVVFGIAVATSMGDDSESASASESLPVSLASAEARDSLLVNFRKAYNSGDYEQVIETFGEAAQVELRASNFDASMEKIYRVASRLNTGAYSHYEVSRIEDGRLSATLYYAVSSPEGALTVSLQFLQQDDEPPGMYRFSIDPVD